MSHVSAVFPDDDTETIQGAGDVYRNLATGADTGGSYYMMEATVPPGGGPPLHVQTREEEGFYVLSGTVCFYSGGNVIEAGPGTLIHVPRNAPHRFKNETADTARMLIWFAPAGIEGMFSKMGKEPERYLEIAREYGVRFPAEE